MPCKHVKRECRLCGSNEHYASTVCPVMVNARSTPPRFGPATLVEADNTSAIGIADNSVNREWNQRKGESGTPDYEKRLKKEESRLAKRDCFKCGKLGHLARNCKGKEVERVESVEKEGNIEEGDMGHSLGLL